MQIVRLFAFFSDFKFFLSIFNNQRMYIKTLQPTNEYKKNRHPFPPLKTFPFPVKLHSTKKTFKPSQL